MKITVEPIDGGFIDRILVFNLTKKPFNNDEIFIDSNIHLAFVLNGALIGVDLENYLFYCYLDKTKDWYGPYASYQEMITNMLFGMYDGLFQVCSLIKFNYELGLYEFQLENFVYNIGTYHFIDVSVKKTAQLLSSIVKPINQEWQFTGEETSFGEGVIDNFLISLNNVFNEDNFPEKYISNNLGTLISIKRNSLFGDKTPFNFYLLINTDKNRHMVAYLPYWIYKEYLTYENQSSNKDLTDVLFETDKTITLSDEEDIFLARKMFGDKFNPKETVLFKVNIYKYIYAIIPLDNKGNLVYILKYDNKWYSLVFNGILKHFTLKDFEPFNSNGIEVKLNNNKIQLGSSCGDGDGFDLSINKKGKCLYLDVATGFVEYLKINFDARFINNIKGIL